VALLGIQAFLDGAEVAHDLFHGECGRIHHRLH
jgi:hypothetical protein